MPTAVYNVRNGMIGIVMGGHNTVVLGNFPPSSTPPPPPSPLFQRPFFRSHHVNREPMTLGFTPLRVPAVWENMAHVYRSRTPFVSPNQPCQVNSETSKSQRSFAFCHPTMSAKALRFRASVRCVRSDRYCYHRIS